MTFSLMLWDALKGGDAEALVDFALARGAIRELAADADLSPMEAADGYAVGYGTGGDPTHPTATRFAGEIRQELVRRHVAHRIRPVVYVEVQIPTEPIYTAEVAARAARVYRTSLVVFDAPCAPPEWWSAILPASLDLGSDLLVDRETLELLEPEARPFVQEFVRGN